MPIFADQKDEREQRPEPASGWIDLAREPAFDLGAARIVPSACEIVVAGERIRLQPRVMQVLCALAQACGELVTRSTLIDRCWAGRAVGDDAINRCIQHLRRVAHTEAPGIFTIETVAGMGYRLPVPSTEPAGEAAESAGTSAPTSLPSRNAWPTKRAGIWAVATVALIGLAVAALRSGGAEWSIVSSRRLISTPLIERYPAISPNADMIAYSAGTDVVGRKIFVRRIAGGEPLRRSFDSFDDTSPQWSPDGGRLAYVASREGEPCRIFVTSPLNGPANLVGRCRSQERTWIAWAPEGKALMFTDSDGAAGPARVIRLDVNTGRRTVVTQPTGLLHDEDVTISPDGARIAFRRRIADTPGRLMVRTLASGAEHEVTADGVAFEGYAWADDSASLFLVESLGRDSVLWSYPVAGGARRRVADVPLEVSRLASGRGGLLAAEITSYRSDAVRPPPAGAATPVSLDEASGATWSLDYAPDGTLAMLSDRSGEFALWIKSPGEAARQLAGFGKVDTRRVAWSPRSDRLVVSQLVAGAATLKVIDTNGLTLATVPVPPGELGPPTWSPDGGALLFTLRDSSGWNLWQADLGPQPRRPFIAMRNWRAVIQSGGALYGTRPDHPGVWRLGQPPVLVSAGPPASAPEGWDMFGTTVVFADKDHRRLVSESPGRPPRVIAETPNLHPNLDFSIDPRSGQPAYIATLMDDSDIELFHLKRQ